jgi:hypothetical protein
MRVALVSAVGVTAGAILLSVVRPFLNGVIAGGPDVSLRFAVIAALALPVLAVVSALRPAIRAMRADPLVALRQQ